MKGLRSALAVGLSLALAGACAPRAEAVGEPPPPSEWEVKAAFLYNFARFVEWPAEAMPGADSPFVIAVVGGDPFGRALDDVLAGKSVAGRRIEVRRLARAEDAANAQILFVGSTAAREVRRILQVVDGAPVLTVGDADGFADHGGIVNFRMRENRVRFEINLAKAEVSGLRISSQLLKLATVIAGKS